MLPDVSSQQNYRVLIFIIIIPPQAGDGFFFEEEELNALLGDLSQHAATLKDISRMRK